MLIFIYFGRYSRCHYGQVRYSATPLDTTISRVHCSHISPFILTQTLLPTLRRTAEDPNNDVRIVVVSYSIHVKFGLDCLLLYLAFCFNQVSSNIHAILKDVRFRNKEDLNREFGETWSPALKRYGS